MGTGNRPESGTRTGVFLISSTGGKPKPAPEEMLSQKGAMALARRLEQFWHEKGYLAARFWAEPIGERFEKVGTYEIYRVVSNLINGLPPLYRDHAALMACRAASTLTGTQA